MPGDAPLPAPIEPIRHLLVLGTSLSENQLWPRLLADRLAKCTGILPEVEVLARAGATSSWGADVLNSRVGPHADAALVEFGVNDADWLDGLSKKRSREAHAAIFADLAGTAVVAMRMNPAYGPRGWVRMGRAAREADIAAQAIAAGAVDRTLDSRPDFDLGLELVIDGLRSRLSA